MVAVCLGKKVYLWNGGDSSVRCAHPYGALEFRHIRSQHAMYARVGTLSMEQIAQIAHDPAWTAPTLKR